MSSTNISYSINKSMFKCVKFITKSKNFNLNTEPAFFVVCFFCLLVRSDARLSVVRTVIVSMMEEYIYIVL